MTVPNRFNSITTLNDWHLKAAEIVEDPGTPRWIVDVITTAAVKDAIDAANCLEMVAELFTRRCELALRLSFAAGSPEEITKATAESQEPFRLGTIMHTREVSPEEFRRLYEGDFTAGAGEAKTGREHVRDYLRDITRPGDEGQFFHDIMTDAVETGAISYWAAIDGVSRDPEKNVVAFTVCDCEDFHAEVKEINADTLKNAILDIIIPSTTIKINPQVADTIREAYMNNDAGIIDAGDMDVIVQVAAYGEIVFG